MKRTGHMTVISERTDPLRQLCIIGRDQASFARCSKRFGRVKADGGEATDPRGGILSSGLRGVFHHGQVDIGRRASFAVEVHDDRRFGPGGDGPAGRYGVHQRLVFQDIDDNRTSAEVADGSGGREEGQGGHQHLVACSHSERAK
jgi:hypothetical protein